MVKNVLVLGASGTVGTAVFKLLSCEESLNIMGTYFSSDQDSSPSLMRFSVEFPDDINAILKQVRPDIVVSSLRGDFEKQLITHENIAEYLITNNGRLIYLSTANVFDGSWDQPHYEDDTEVSNSDYRGHPYFLWMTSQLVEAADDTGRRRMNKIQRRARTVPPFTYVFSPSLPSSSYRTP